MNNRPYRSGIFNIYWQFLSIGKPYAHVGAQEISDDMQV